MYNAFIHTKMDLQLQYGSLSKNNMACMDSFQNCLLSIVIGQLISTLIEALQIEVNAQSYTTINNVTGG